uniref:Immunoglobulin domain-containing protein n=1 Tax=Chelonoidis abingdonii TaxID=106734 RepID=A0A8C0GYQ9_CHEAB
GLALAACLLCADPSLPRPSISLTGREYPKPTIWVSPSRVVALGGSVTIRCEGLYRGLEFVLLKAGHPNLQVWLVPDGTVAEFPIPRVGWEDGGSYTCDCHSITDQSHWLYLSDPVEIIVAGEGYPKPSISLLSPSWGVFLGGAVTVQCCGQNQGLQFMLNKEGRYVQSVNSDFLALFHINNVRQEHGGSYSCSYHSQSEPSAMSDPSDLMELVVRDPSLPRPNISLNVTMPGADATIRCQGQRQDVRFFLYKAGDLNPQQHMDPAANVVEFRIPTVGRQHGGNYSCSYRPQSQPFISSEPSDPVKITAAGEGSGSVSRLPALPPARPTGGFCTVGTLRTRVALSPGTGRGDTFVLHKAGHPNLQVWLVPDGTMAEFPIPSVSREDGGSYTCNCHSITDQSHWSYLIDPVEVIVAGEWLGSASRLTAPHPARCTESLCAYGTLRVRPCPEPWAQQRGRLATGNPTPLPEPGAEPRSPGSQPSQQRTQGMNGPWKLDSV